jgi:hypothetical protein
MTNRMAELRAMDTAKLDRLLLVYLEIEVEAPGKNAFRTEEMERVVQVLAERRAKEGKA